MIVAESRRGRRLVGRLDRGAELLAAIAGICQARGVHAGELRAFGTVEEVELGEFDQRGRAWRPPRRFASPFTIVHCIGTVMEQEGRIRVQATCALSREGDNGIELLGGHLLRARVHAVEFVLECFDDLVLHRSMDAATGLPLLAEARLAPAAAAPPQTSAALAAAAPVPAPAEARLPAIPFEAPARGRVADPSGRATLTGPTAPTAPTAIELPDASAEPTWAEVAARSADRDAPAASPVVHLVSEPASVDEEPSPEEPIREGDVIDHPRFGRCEVERIEGETEYAQVRLRNHRLVRLSLDVLQLVRDGNDERGHRRYRAEVPR